MHTDLTIPGRDLCPEDVFESGQTFRFRKTRTGYLGVAGHAVIETVDKGGDIEIISTMDEEALRTYFDLGRSYGPLLPSDDPVLAEAVAHAPGLRVLNQDPFETLISFILSANNNIPRIRSLVEALCTEAGDGIEYGTEVLHAFPTPEQLAQVTEERLRQLGCGYRAPYIAASSRLAQDTDLEQLRQVPYAEAKRRLLSFPGVGSKVADCICLFSLGKSEAFPVDVWIERILRMLYGFTGSRKQMEAFAARRFGATAGIAQQYLFHYARHVLPKGK